MFGYFKKAGSGRPVRLVIRLTNLEKAAQKKFAQFMSRQEKRCSLLQRKIVLTLFCLLIILVNAVNIYLPKNRPASADTNTPVPMMAVPKDITLPDSLDINLIRQYQAMQRQQDSIP